MVGQHFIPRTQVQAVPLMDYLRNNTWSLELWVRQITKGQPPAPMFTLIDQRLALQLARGAVNHRGNFYLLTNGLIAHINLESGHIAYYSPLFEEYAEYWAQRWTTEAELPIESAMRAFFNRQPKEGE
jgi:hypothetical protein